MSTTVLNSQSCQSLADWLCYIEQSHPVHQIELGLERVHAVAARAGLQHLPGKKVLIAGTNGKGTTACCIEQLLLAQGKTVGVYSSPHLLQFNERLRLNGQDVADADWVAAFAFVEALRQDIALTYFEFTTLVAFRLLQQQQPEYCLIEVGLGGRLDATNIISPDISVITTVDLDHQDWLGNDRDSIGREKAGVFRAGGIAIIGELNPPQSVLHKAAELACKTVLVQRDYHYHYQNHYGQQYLQQQQSWQWQGVSQQFDQLPVPALPIQNVACSLAVLEQLNMLPSPQQLCSVLAGLTLAGRMQWLQQQPAIIVDVAHNPQSARYLAQQLQLLKPRFRRILALVGMLKDKDIEQTLLPLTPLFEQWHLVSLKGVRGATAEQLDKVLALHGVVTQLHEDTQSAYQQLQQRLQSDELLVVFGSFITVSAVLSCHQEAK
ncbi:dihydrofolate synthase/folylpolyglutamate synthase [Rheinheimera pacifica]|uniref:bifunctional tetrahydrofolate synthase/dihydrofolate synthase n=1 Tax=Rheinheimera pacifica TaxID=173990 RepID=UPI002855CAF7|nr:bifunctional tetrahydrofolate synthase/dihydrofolate synthase [Rheinheimera pacifica]MDR6984661.1 dihydrofolate synthase/folylpolyglutamate synthase [Rheinheimera pacifica]